MAKKIAKPAPKPTPKPLPRPKPAPIDLVRNPNFDAAMAQQNYQNSLAGLTARAQAGQFDEGFRADGGQAFPSEFSRPSQEPMINPEVIQKARTEYLASQPQDRKYSQVMTKTKYGGEFGSSVGRGFDKWFEQNYINDPNSALLEQERMSLQNMSRQSTNSTAGYVQQDPMAGMQNNPSIYDSLRPDYSQVGTVPMRSPQNPNQMNFGQIAQGIGRLMPQIPQGQQQMQSYQNFLNQGMNNMASVNQGAAANFANTQPGMPTTGSAQQFAANPAMPVAGMGMQKSNTTPRKFSTVNTPSARFA